MPPPIPLALRTAAAPLEATSARMREATRRVEGDEQQEAGGKQQEHEGSTTTIGEEHDHEEGEPELALSARHAALSVPPHASRTDRASALTSAPACLQGLRAPAVRSWRRGEADAASELPARYWRLSPGFESPGRVESPLHKVSEGSFLLSILDGSSSVAAAAAAAAAVQHAAAARRGVRACADVSACKRERVGMSARKR